MRIRTAVFGVYVALTAAGMLLLLVFVLKEVRWQSFAVQRSIQWETARVLVVAVERAMRAGVVLAEAGAEVLRELPRDGIGVALVEMDGGVVASGGRSVPDGRLPGGDSDPRPQKLWREEGHPERVATAVVGDWFWVRTVVTVDKHEAGWLMVGRPVTELHAPIWRSRLRIAAVASMVAVILALAGWWLSARLTGALDRLRRHAEAVRAGERSVLGPSRADEVRVLGDAFEAMRKTLEDRAYVERYAAALTHELKSPVTAITSAAELLEEGPPLADRKRFLASIRAEARRIGRLAERLLALAAVENRRALGPEAREIVPADLVRLVAMRFAATAAAAQVRLITAGDDGLAPIHGDAELLEDAFGQLVANAITASPPGAEVNLEWRRHENGVVLRVADRGHGLPEFALERVFERFYSLPQPGSSRKGTGLGLAFAREVALLHGGSAALAPRPGGGTVAELRV